MKEEIIELVEDCKLVHSHTEVDGCDCWGVPYHNSWNFVFIGDKMERCPDGWYVIHDGKNVKEIVSKDMLEHRKYMKKTREEMKEHLEKTGFETPREYAAYLKGKNERNG